MARFDRIGDQYEDDAGSPLLYGKLYFYEPGGTTAKATFADVGQTIQNTNPVLLTAAGRSPNIFFSGSARVILTNSDDVQIRELDPTGGDTTLAAFSDWNSDAVYNVPDIVIGPDGNFYISITDGNTGNTPASSPANWTQIRFIRVWNTNEVYSVNQIVEAADGLLYTSITNSNTGNNPTGDLANWKSSTSADVPKVVLAAGKQYAYSNF